MKVLLALFLLIGTTCFAGEGTATRLIGSGAIEKGQQITFECGMGNQKSIGLVPTQPKDATKSYCIYSESQGTTIKYLIGLGFGPDRCSSNLDGRNATITMTCDTFIKK